MEKILYLGNIADEPHLWNVIPNLYWSRKEVHNGYVYGLAFKPQSNHIGIFYTISQIIGTNEVTIQEIGGIKLDKAMMQNDIDYINTQAAIHITPDKHIHLWREQ